MPRSGDKAKSFAKQAQKKWPQIVAIQEEQIKLINVPLRYEQRKTRKAPN
jgi:hypothetical protein